MAIPIEHPDFQQKQLSLRGMTFWSAPRLLLNGELCKRSAFAGTMSLVDDHGRERHIRFRGGYPFDPMPPIEIDGTLIHLAPRLNIFSILWCMLPLLLVGLGGAVGGALGVLTVYVNFRVMRTPYSLFLRYLGVLGVSLGALVIFMVIAIVVQLVFLR